MTLTPAWLNKFDSFKLDLNVSIFTIALARERTSGVSLLSFYKQTNKQTRLKIKPVNSSVEKDLIGIDYFSTLLHQGKGNSD